MSIRLTILSEIEKIATAQNRPIGALQDDLPLSQSGFDSLCFALLVAKLDDDLGLDPFSAPDGIAFPVTVGEFIRLYEDAARQTTS